MDKRVVLAVAGSGKTRSIVDKLSLEKRALILTYTNNNYENLRQRIIEKFGEVPANISLYTYFSFLYSFCYLPCVYHKINSRSINYESYPRKGPKATNPFYYLDYDNNLLGNRLALLVNNFALDDVKLRIQRFYDQFIIDEVQDFSANDFNFINALADASIDILYVGDYFQHTYDTSRDGTTRQNLYKNGYDKYKKQFNKALEIDDESLLNSYRCSKTICDFVTNNLGITIEAHEDNETTIEIVKNKDLIAKHMSNSSMPKLFYQGYSNYECLSTNWGASKGIDHFIDVCIVLNATTQPMVERNDFSTITSLTKNRLYVAMTRARRNVYFIDENNVKEYLKKTN